MLRDNFFIALIKLNLTQEGYPRMKEIGKVYGLNGKEVNLCVAINMAVSVIPSEQSLTLSGIRLFGVTTDQSICDTCRERDKCKIDENELVKKVQSYLIKKKLYP